MKHVIIGKPQQQERPRVGVVKTGSGYKARVFDPPKSRAAKSKIAMQLKRKKITPSEKALKIIIGIYVEIPKSYTKKQRAAIADGTLLPAKKPDVSNYIKLIEDACNGILYKDDSQIVQIEASKHYTDNPRIEVEIVEL